MMEFNDYITRINAIRHAISRYALSAITLSIFAATISLLE